jgi:hypothetical protein
LFTFSARVFSFFLGFLLFERALMIQSLQSVNPLRLHCDEINNGALPLSGSKDFGEMAFLLFIFLARFTLVPPPLLPVACRPKISPDYTTPAK